MSEASVNTDLQLLKVTQVAAALQVSVDYVYDRIAEGSLPVVQLGTGRSLRRVRVKDLAAFIENQSASTI